MTYAWPKAVLLAALAFLLCLDLAPVRHAVVVGMGDCAVRQFVHLPGHVDMMALGSSRVRAAVSTQAIAAASGGVMSANFNLGRSGLSAMRSYVTLRDTLDRGVRPRVVVLEIDLDALQRRDADGRVRLPLHAAIMRWHDIGLLLDLHSDLSTVERWRLVLLAAAAKVRGAIIPMLGGAPVTGQLGIDAPVADCQAGLDAEQARQGVTELAERRRTAQAALREIALAPADAPARREELFFVERVRALCLAHGIGLVVVRPGAAYEPVLSPRALADVRALVPEFDEPPAALVQAAWAEFLDASHMGPGARERYSVWLTGRMLEAARS